MSSPYCNTTGPHSIDEDLQGLQSRMDALQAIGREIDERLAAIRTCPEPCRDGKVLIQLTHGKPRRMDCPCVSETCAYGADVRRELDRFLAGILLRAGVPERHVENLAHLMDTKAVSEARKWFYRRGFLIFGGVPGVGKSFGAAYGIYWYLRQHLSHWTDKTTWSEASRAGAGVQWTSAKGIADDKALALRCAAARLIVIDDLGKEDETKTGLAAVCNVICKRYDARLPTIATSELSSPDVEKRYGRYIVERLAEDAESRWFDCGTTSIRFARKDGGA